MHLFSEYIGSQFGNPHGIVGKVCCVIMNVINKSMYKRIVSSIQPNKNTCILDIGYGNGYLIQKLYKKSKSLIYGIDISEDMKKVATKRNHKAVLSGKVRMSIGDCCSLEFRKEKFDIVTSVNTIYFWKDTIQGLKEVRRVLKDGGVFYNVVYSKEWLQKLSYTKKGFAFFDKKDYIADGKEAGFSKVSIMEIMSGRSYIIKYVR